MKATTLKVRAADPSKPCPMCKAAGKRGLQFIGAEPVEVPNDPYYRRRLRAGDLVEVKE